MSNNEIALIFDTAEYYSFQEASEYLNKKYKTDNITPKKLLKQISSRNINTFIHFRMDNLSNKPLRLKIESYESNIFPIDKNTHDLDKIGIEPILETLNKLERFVSNNLISSLYMGAVLFAVSGETLSNMALNNNSKNRDLLFSFNGFIHKPNYDDNPYKPMQLAEWQVALEDEKYNLIEIDHMSFVIDSIDDEDLRELEEKMPFPCSFEKRSTFTFLNIHISLDDLLIMHRDLISLEEEISENKPFNHQTKFAPRKGVSHRKILAKEFARHIAIEGWKRDTAQDIKISKMCEIVWSKLVDSNFDGELPDSVKSLKPWIKEIAPSYASEAGRPKS
mgnify:CR=1 FL=1